MASGKKRRKEIKQGKLRQQPAGPRKVKDGDRRRRGMYNYEEAMARKRFMQTGAMPSPDDAAE